ncbi:hypothetical protein Esti_003493 [Eimeria stiedai]
MRPVRDAGLVAALAAVILPHSGETFEPISHLSSLHSGPASSHWHSWIPAAASYQAPSPSASWLELTAHAGTQSPGTQGSEQTENEGASGISSSTHSDGSSQTTSDSTSVEPARQRHDSLSGFNGGTEDGQDGGQQTAPHKRTGPPSMHPVIKELKDKLGRRSPVHHGGTDDITNDSGAPPSPPPHQGPPPSSEPADTGERQSSQGAAGFSHGASDQHSSQTGTSNTSSGSDATSYGSYGSSDQQSPQNDQQYGPPPTGGNEHLGAMGGGGEPTPVEDVPTDPEGLVLFFNNARKGESEERIEGSMLFEEGVESFIRSDGHELLECIKVKSTTPSRFALSADCDVFEKRARDACVGQAMAALGVISNLTDKCHGKRFPDCLQQVTLPLVHPLFSDFDETSGFGLGSVANEAFRIFYPGKRNDKTVEDFDRLISWGKPSSLYYGTVLDVVQGLRSKLKKTSQGWFSRKRAKAAAVRKYAMTGLLAVAKPPHLDDVVIKAVLDMLNFEDCSTGDDVSIKDKRGRTKKVDVVDLRHRALAKALGSAVRAPPDPRDAVSAYNKELIGYYMGSYEQLQAISKLIQFQATTVPGRRPAPPGMHERLLQYLQERTEVTIYACKTDSHSLVTFSSLFSLTLLECMSIRMSVCTDAPLGLKLREVRHGAFVKFVKKNKLLRSALIGYMSLLLKLGSRFLRRAARDLKGGFDDPNASILPPIPVLAEVWAWLEGVRVLARHALFLGDPGSAKFDSQLCVEVVKHALGSVTRKEEKALAKAQKKMDKEEEKRNRKGGKLSGFFSLFKRKKRGDGGDDDEPGSSQPVDKKAAKALTKEEKRRQKLQKKAEKEAKKRQKDLDKQRKRQEKELEKEQKRREKKLEKQEKKQEKELKKQQKQDEKATKEAAKQRRKEENKVEETRFLQLSSVASSPTLLTIRPHDARALANPEASSLSFLQTKTRISPSTNTLLVVFAAIVGSVVFVASIVLGQGIVAIVILLAATLTEYYLFS